MQIPDKYEIVVYLTDDLNKDPKEDQRIILNLSFDPDVPNEKRVSFITNLREELKLHFKEV